MKGKQARRTKEEDRKRRSAKHGSIVEQTLASRVVDPDTGIVKYPARTGHHGTDDERVLNPEE
jgi:hypothetical protein